MYYDDSGNSAVHAIRGAWWTGTRVGAGINYGIQAATGASLGILLYETFNDGIDFGDAANDDTYEQCPLDVPDDCDLERARIIKKEIAIKNDIQSGSPRFGPNAGNEILWASTIKAKKKAWNEWVNDYNRRCPRKIGRRFKL